MSTSPRQRVLLVVVLAWSRALRTVGGYRHGVPAGLRHARGGGARRSLVLAVIGTTESSSDLGAPPTTTTPPEEQQGDDAVVVPPGGAPAAAANGQRAGASTPTYESFRVELARPLGVTVQESRDGAVYVLQSRGNAQAAGVRVGDVVTGVSAVFGDDVWNVRGKGVRRVEGLIQTHEGDTVKLDLERGHSYHLLSPDDAAEEASFANDMDSQTMKMIFGRGAWDDTPVQQNTRKDRSDRFRRRRGAPAKEQQPDVDDVFPEGYLAGLYPSLPEMDVVPQDDDDDDESSSSAS